MTDAAAVEALGDAVVLLEACNQRRYDDMLAILNAIVSSGREPALRIATNLLAAWRALGERHPADAVDVVAALRECVIDYPDDT